MKIDLATYGQGENSVLVVNRAIATGLRDAGLLRDDLTPPLNPGVNWEGVATMADRWRPGADAIVCQASISLPLMQRVAKESPKTKIILQRDSTHCRWWKRLVEEEQDRFGIKWSVYGGGLLEREMAEYEIADTITVLSHWVEGTFIEQGFDDKVVHVGPQTFDRDKWPVAKYVTDWTKGKRFRVMFAGQTGLRKGLFYLLEAWKRLGLPNGELLIAGVPESPCQELHDEIRRQIADTPNCTALGFVDIRKMPDLYADCHVLCIPSIEEGSTMTGLEALSVGRPVIATPNAGIDVLEHNVNGFVVEPRSWEAIADAIAYYHDNPDLWSMHAMNAPNSVDGCDVPEFGKRYVERIVEALTE